MVKLTPTADGDGVELTVGAAPTALLDAMVGTDSEVLVSVDGEEAELVAPGPHAASSGRLQARIAVAARFNRIGGPVCVSAVRHHAIRHDVVSMCQELTEPSAYQR
jgi:hypothetical protein